MLRAKMFHALFLLFLLSAGIALPVHAQTPAESSVTHFSQQDTDGDGKPDVALIRYAPGVLGSGPGSITVYDRSNDMQLSDDWQRGTDVKNDIWLIDAGSTRQVMLAIDFRMQEGQVIADVYDDQNHDGAVAFELRNAIPVVTESPVPTVRVIGLGGWWTKEDKVNYNLDVQVSGPAQASWGGDQWVSLIAPGEKSVEIHTRDIDGDGIPDWDFRSVLPTLPGLGILRSHYAERKCPVRLQPEKGLIPSWPYLTTEGSFEQAVNSLAPPIVLDVSQQRITFFSEVVTARFQRCSYALYTLQPIQWGVNNEVDFEAPFAFYDLSGQGQGYPNLILRTEGFPQGDRWSKPGNQEWHRIRYSWRDQMGDGYFDYKVEVMGFHPFNFNTHLAGGQINVDAPSYESFPKWITGNSWPVVTFIDTEGKPYPSSEGIYEWSPLDIGDDYFQGRAQTSNPAAFCCITHGLRGEYRFNQPGPPFLYLSTVDRRLHLVGAQGGIWDLGNGLIMKEMNLDNRSRINGWVKARRIAHSDPDGKAIFEEETIETIYAPAGFLVYSGHGNVEIKATGVKADEFQVLPPDDPSSWQAFRDMVDPYTASRRDPADLKTWLSDFPGQATFIHGASITGFTISGSNFHFVLTLEEGYRWTGFDRLNLSGRAPGQYLVESAGDTFVIRPLTPAQISLSIASPVEDGPASAVWAILDNSGLTDATGLELVCESIDLQGKAVAISRQGVDSPAGQATRLLMTIPPRLPENVSLRLRLVDSQGQTTTTSNVIHRGAPPGLVQAGRILNLSTAGYTRLGWLVILALLFTVPLAVRFRCRRAMPGKTSQ